MANRPQPLLTPQRLYARNDLAALRAYVQRVAPATIARLYYNEEEDEHARSAAAMTSYLRAMHDDLVRLAIEHGSPVLAAHLTESRSHHGAARLTAASLRMVEEAAQLAIARPLATHGIGLWFRPMLARYLKAQHVTTLGDLIDLCNRRGGSWWRSVPRVGALRARTIVAWLRAHETTLGVRVRAEVETTEPFMAGSTQVVEVGGAGQRTVPLERMTLAAALSGAHGVNRSAAFSFVAARHDLEAVRAYLNQFREQPKTLRAYTKELERFVLWAVCVRGTAMSSLLVEDCEAYKDFLRAPSAGFVGLRAPRHSDRWRPFAEGELSATSRRYAVRALRAAFTWLVDVRYLAGNPWKAVKDPATVEPAAAMRVARALSAELWQRLRTFLDARCAQGDAVAEASKPARQSVQWRIARAAILLMGDSGLRREEAATARRAGLGHSPHAAAGRPVWQLTVVGKRHAERTVPVSAATVAALRAHWRDRGQDFDHAGVDAPLLAPRVIPNTEAARQKHQGALERPYSTDAIGRLVVWALGRARVDMADLSPEDRLTLSEATAHAFRHTFGTQAAARDMPIDVVQRILGHKSLQTTTIYIQAEQRRMMEEADKYFTAKPPES